MTALHQWHPLYPIRWLGRKPVALKFLGRELVLFRTRAGALGVLPDCCPHRGMRLSKGRVNDGRLVCPYHGWRFDPNGQGESPGSPRLQVCTPHFDVAEHEGMIWVKDPEGTGVLPSLRHDGYQLLHLAYVPLRAPVESLMENFTEIEHTGTAHAQFGYDGNRMDEVQFEAEADADTVHIRVNGPQKPLWPMSRWAMGVRKGDRLCFDWTTRFAPLRAEADFWWEDPRTGQPRPCRFKEHAYFIPVSPTESLSVGYYLWSFQGVRRHLSRLLRPFVNLGVRREIALDKWLIENVIPETLFAPGRRLGRFDKGLQELRKRWQRWREDYGMPPAEGRGSLPQGAQASGLG